MVFFAIIAFSLAIALWSRLGHTRQRAEEFFVAAGKFGTALFFFLAVGETYSIGTILGFPGGVYAHGTSFIEWFLGYILLAFPVGYFLNPWIWRAGRRYGAITLPDMFRSHYESRALELVVAVTSILFLVPLGVMQFVGLDTVLHGLHLPIPPIALAAGAGALAFSYIAVSGIRAPAYVAILKDLLMMAAILMTGIAVLACSGAAPGMGGLRGAGPHRAALPSDLFSISTILLQSVGFCLVPHGCATVFTARSAATVRRAQMLMPLYMVMFPFLVLVATVAVSHHLALASPNDVFLASARLLLPGWALGMVMAGAALSALVVLSGICLALGPLVTRNLLPGLDGAQQTRLAKAVIALYLALSIAGAAHFNALMVAINNLFYFGVTQSFPGLLAILLLRRSRPSAIIVGLLAGDAIALGLHFAGIAAFGINPGFIGLAANLAIVFGAARLLPGTPRTPLATMVV